MNGHVRIFSASLWARDMFGKHESVPLMVTYCSLGGGPSMNGGKIDRGALREPCSITATHCLSQ